jgi:predicted AAA+ superfamily ATPase
LLVDEIQLCTDFEVIINSLHEEEKFDIYLTGSNAFLLSSDLATLFGGRVFYISIFPFSFEEYNLYYPSNDIDKSFDNYVVEGGMAGLYLYKNKSDGVNYVHNILRTWTKGKVIDNKYSMTSSKYDIVKIENIEYLTYEWKSGDYIFGKRKSGKHILIKE